MEILFSFIAGLVLASIGALLMLHHVKSSAAADRDRALADAARQADSDRMAATAILQANLDNATRNAEQAKHDAQQHTQELLDAQDKAHHDAIEAIEKRHAEAIAAERTRIQETIDKMAAQVKITTGEILKQQQEELKNTNKESVEKLIEPLNHQMESMNKLMADTRSANEKSTSSLEGVIKQMVQQTETVGRQADNLAEAMKNKGKVHGDWGEQVLEDILRGSGLREGVEYSTQQVIPIGNRESYRPDVIINIADGRHIIVDSKVTLTAYSDAIGANTKEEYEQCVKKNYDSVWTHVNELANKQYHKYVDGAMNYVLMFVSNEGAYVMAMNYKQSLAQDAYRKGIIIINPTNLMLTLSLVLQTWNGIRQEDNCRKIIEAANGMYDKVVGLVDTSVTLSKQLATATGTCKTLTDQMIDGRGNLLKRVDDLRGLGITSTKRPKVARIASDSTTDPTDDNEDLILPSTNPDQQAE